MASWRPAIPTGLALLTFVLAFAQRPGKVYFDTRVELTADPGLFLHRVASMWSATTDLGHIQTSQFVGYLFPMAPWYALSHAAGVPMWVAERLWLGGVLALAAWGAVRLMDALYDDRRGIAHLGAGLLYAVNPAVVLFTDRGSVVLLAYAALPWLMLATARGVAEPRRWRWPAIAALVLATSGGGVNVAVPALVLPGPLLLLVYEVLVRGRRWGDVWAFGWRTSLCGAIANAWWLVPLLVSSHYAADFLKFTEQPDAIFGDTSMSESLRQLGYWVTYLGVGSAGIVAPTTSIAPTYLFSRPVMAATLIVPLIALVGGVRMRRGWVYAPLFGVLAVVALVTMSAGFPEETRVSHALVSIYYHGSSFQALRTTYKAVPLVALSIACLGGAAAPAVLAGARRLGETLLATRAFAYVAGAFLLLLAVLYGAPMYGGHATDSRNVYRVPASWKQSVADAARAAGPNRRIMTLPGHTLSEYKWGYVETPIGPAITRHPVLDRYITRYAEPRASRLQTAIDDTIGQGRLVPGQLDPLLEVLGVGQVLVAADLNPNRSDALDQPRLAEALAGQPSFARPVQSYGRVRGYVPPSGFTAPSVSVPDMRRYAAPPGPGIVRVHPSTGAIVLDGDGNGVAELAAAGALDPGQALLYAGDVSRTKLRGLVAAGAQLVFSDSNRRAILLGSRIRADVGPTLGAGDPIDPAAPTYDLFPARGAAGMTVATFTGLRYLRAPESPGYWLFPQHRPFAAMDGRLDTAWLAADFRQSQRHLDLGLASPHPVRQIRIYPEADSSSRTVEVAIRVNGGLERLFPLHPGWNSLRIDANPLRTLRIRIAQVSQRSVFGTLGGISELSVPGVTVDERLRLPTDLSAEARGLDLSHTPVSVLLRRTTADFPYRGGADDGFSGGGDAVDMIDAEPGIERRVTLPVARRFHIDGWASVRPDAQDSLLDRLVGVRDGWRFESSSRFEGLPARRASSAFDGDPNTGWVGNALFNRPVWLSVRAPRSFTVSRVRLRPFGPTVPFPTRVKVQASGWTSRLLRPDRAGWVGLGRRVRTSELRVNVLAAATPRNVGFFGGLRAVGVSEVQIPGLRPPAPPRKGRFETGCGAIRATGPGSSLEARVSGTVAELDAGRPLRATGCGGDLALPAGASALSVPEGSVMRADHVRLLSPPPAGALATPVAPPQPHVTSLADPVPKPVALHLTARAWVVLAKSYSSGWRAYCREANGAERSLGRPVPVDAYANGWQAGPDCRRVRFAFAPQRAADVAMGVSLVGCAALLALLVAIAVRRRRDPTDPPPAADAWYLPRADRLRRVGWRGTLAIVAGAAAIGWLFGGPLALLLAAAGVALARIGWNVRRLLSVSAVAFAALPVIYVLSPPRNEGGFSFAYARDEIGAHWIAWVAVVCLAAACLVEARDARLARRALPAPADEPSDSG